ncbi:hypothetical protein ASD50_20725 [Mesorhizobium sp. Root552]|uniref:tail fiber domain-containing protein n=1 Tax=Mesorhizobium sp. Root552 TaxID=1736555 RepID=UPI0006FD9C8C|nr:tail fiber domain-containing protein [Mesorhizobium sp. Root552]KQZ25850.1 hypothetical protein ASD50_20725 [Mesorhizobium sp. Root552]
MGKSAPKPPDPKETSAASTSTNVGTAVANAFMGNVNQVTPDGTLNYNQTGTYKWNDPYTGKSYDIPTFTATQTLSEAQQQMKNQTDQAQINLATLAKDQSGRLNDILAKPFDPNSVDAPSLTTDFSADRQKVEDALMARLQPKMDQDRTRLETQLANSGIQMGSDAYSRAMNDNNSAVNDARLGAILSAGQEQSRLTQLNNSTRAQAMQEAFAGRNQPINEITALMSGSQVSNPNFVNANMPSIPTTDVAGLINENYNQKLAAYQQKAGAAQNVLGGLFGLGGSMIMASDRRLKTDIKKVGKTEDGQNLYSYRYKAGGPMQIGLMAQEVKKKHPEAIVPMKSGHMAVDYSKALPMGSVFGMGKAA